MESGVAPPQSCVIWWLQVGACNNSEDEDLRSSFSYQLALCSTVVFGKLDTDVPLLRKGSRHPRAPIHQGLAFPREPCLLFLSATKYTLVSCQKKYESSLKCMQRSYQKEGGCGRKAFRLVFALPNPASKQNTAAPLRSRCPLARSPVPAGVRWLSMLDWKGLSRRSCLRITLLSDTSKCFF